VEFKWDFGEEGVTWYFHMLLFLNELLFERAIPCAKLMLAVAVQLTGWRRIPQRIRAHSVLGTMGGYGYGV
jgi:hypothetical protein